MLTALQLVIGVGIALLFPLLMHTGVAVVKPPPKRSILFLAVTAEDVARQLDRRSPPNEWLARLVHLVQQS